MKLNEIGHTVASYTAIGAGSATSTLDLNYTGIEVAATFMAQLEGIAAELQPIIIVLTFVLIIFRVPIDAIRFASMVKTIVKKLFKK